MVVDRRGFQVPLARYKSNNPLAIKDLLQLPIDPLARYKSNNPLAIKDLLQLPIDPLARYKSNNPGRLIVIAPGTPTQVWPRSPPFPLVGWGRREVGRGDGGSGTEDGG
jgi:hypothetical protein